MTGIKMCGLRRPEDIEAVNGLKPEYIGFVFFSGSRRYVTEIIADHVEIMDKRQDKPAAPVTPRQDSDFTEVDPGDELPF